MKSSFLLAPLLLAAGSLTAATVSIGVTFGDVLPGIKGPDNSTFLSPGNFAINGDGAVVQIGYFTSSTSGNLFAGTFVPLTGNGGVNSGLNATSIGDYADNYGTSASNFTSLEEAQGKFVYASILLDDASATTGNSLPSAGKYLAIRFFNAPTIAASTHYNTVSSLSWTWSAPATPASSVNLVDGDTLVWESGLSGAEFTAIAIPEPAAIAGMFGLGVLGLTLLRRRR